MSASSAMLARSHTAAAPSLLQEILGYQPRQTQNSDEAQACNHVYFSNPDRSRVPNPNQLPVESATWSAAATCQRCRWHFDGVITFPARTRPCPSEGRPFHFFQKVAPEDGNPTHAPNVFPYKCLAEECQAELLVLYQSPDLLLEDVSYLTDPAALHARFAAAQTDHPDIKEKGAFECLKIFRSAIIDALQEREERDIPVGNKIFKICLGDGIEPLFTRLGFSRYSDASNKAYWKLPKPGKHPFDPYYDKLRSKLENVRDEVTSLMLLRPEQERRNVNWTPPSLSLAQHDIERILSIQAEDSRSFNLANLSSLNDDTPYRSLGVVQNFPDELISWAFNQQTKADPGQRSSFLKDFKHIAEFRQSEVLQTEAAIAESLQAGTASTMNGQAFRLETYTQALAYIGAQEDTSDEFVFTLMTSKVAEDPSTEEKAREAVQIIAKERNSEALSNQLTGTQFVDIQMTLEKAQRTLGVSEDIEDAHIIAQYEINVKESPKRTEEFREALAFIAAKRDSEELRAYLWSRPYQPPAIQIGFEQPRALKNIGNTCYLNSLLQYLATIKPLRDLVANIQELGETTNPSSLATKLVGNSHVSSSQVRRALLFAEELDKLFASLVTEQEPVVTPSTNLARLTLINVVDRDVQRRASTITAPPKILLEDTNGVSALADVAEKDDETAIELERTQTPGEIPMLEDVSDDHLPAQNGVDPIGTSGHPEMKDSTTTKGSSSSLPSSTAAQVDEMEAMIIDTEALPDGTNAQKPLSHIPLVPERPQLPNRPSAPATVTQEVENWAKQQDVREVMQNVLSQLRWATKPSGHEKKGEQIDTISRLFYGKEKYTVVNEKGEQSSEEPFLEIMLYLSGACDLYAALDDLFDASEVEGLSNTAQYRTILNAPPILQLSVSRVGYNKVAHTSFKVDDPLQLYDRIYMDRYMDSELILSKRRQAWSWKAELRVLKERRAKHTMPELDLDAAGVLRSTSAYLKGLTSNAKKLKLDISLIDDALLGGLENLANVVAEEIAQLDAKINVIENNLVAVFEENQELSYRLHAVFIHRGDSNAKGGHWFIYIHDAEQHVWRCYNDETITVVTNTRPIFTPAKEWSEGTSSFIVYVREDAMDQIVQTVCRKEKPFEDVTSQEELTNGS